MKNYTSLIALALLAFALAGCSKNSQSAGLPKNNDLGVIDVSSGKPSNHILADGRSCTITPAIMPDGDVSLATQIDDGGGSPKTMIFETPADGRVCTFAVDKSTVITVALRK